MMKLRRDAFTLIEMLTVMVIIVIILSIGVPAFTNLMKSGGLTGASREVANSLGLARQYAITHRTVTRVVFPYSGTTLTTGTNLCPWYQSYAVLDIGSTNYISKWEHLPMGTVFMCDSVLLGSGPHPCLDTLTTAGLPFPSTNSPLPLITLAYIEFQPTGAASAPASLTITEGFMSGTNVVPTSKTSTSLVNSTIISVDNVVGRIRTVRP